jgi:hypothetical protein
MHKSKPIIKIIYLIILTLMCVLLVIPAKAMQKDTVYIYKYGDFLFEASGLMKVDFIVKEKASKKNIITADTMVKDSDNITCITITGNPSNKRISKGDTLYNDANYTILGDATVRIGMGIFKRYSLKYHFFMFNIPIYKGKLAPPDFKTDPGALMFRTQIKEQCKSEKINFAGHYTVVELGCGTECIDIAIADRITGEIHYRDISYGKDEGFWGVDHKANSRLFIENSFDLMDHPGYTLLREYERLKLLEWTGSKLKRLP